MAKLHNKVEAAELLPQVQAFLAACRSPAVLEQGDQPIPLLPGTFELQLRGNRLYIEASGEARVLARHITSIDNQRPGILDCTFQRFGGAAGRVSFLDLDRPQTAHRRASASRQNFAQQFRTMLRRQFPHWQIDSLSSSLDLRRSFSPVFPRATLSRGARTVAAIACPDLPHESEFLTFALLWLAHVSDGQTSLCLFLPQGSGSLTAHRLRWLRFAPVPPRLFLFNEHGSAGEVDAADLGNIDTRVSSRFLAPQLSPNLQQTLAELAALPHVSIVPELPGAVSIRYRGVEFAKAVDGRVTLGLAGPQSTMAADDLGLLKSFALQLLDLQQFPGRPERWLEGAVRENIQLLDADLLPSPVHGEVLTFSGRDRESVDLLAISPAGRLAILELKASEDLHLPLQALDYWIRIKWHLERNEIAHLFPHLPLTSLLPRLLLVAPALSFHSANVTVLRHFSPEVEVERIGVNSDWRTQFRVVLRLTGADTPISHGRF